MRKAEIRYQPKYSSRNPIEVFLNQRYHLAICTLIREVGPETVLDVGCGEGVVIDKVLKEIENVSMYGLDVRLGPLKVAQTLNPYTKFSVASAYFLPFKKNSYDLVLCNEVLEHLQRPAEAFSELVRVTSKFVIISVPNEPLWRICNILRLRYLRRLGNTPSHIHNWTPFSIKALARNYFKVVKTKYSYMWTMLLLKKEEVPHRLGGT